MGTPFFEGDLPPSLGIGPRDLHADAISLFDVRACEEKVHNSSHSHPRLRPLLSGVIQPRVRRAHERRRLANNRRAPAAAAPAAAAGGPPAPRVAVHRLAGAAGGAEEAEDNDEGQESDARKDEWARGEGAHVAVPPRRRRRLQVAHFVSLARESWVKETRDKAPPKNEQNDTTERARGLERAPHRQRPRVALVEGVQLREVG